MLREGKGPLWGLLVATFALFGACAITPGAFFATSSDAPSGGTWNCTTATRTYADQTATPSTCPYNAASTTSLFTGMNNPYDTAAAGVAYGSNTSNNFGDSVPGESQYVQANSASSWQVVNNTPTSPGTQITSYPSNGIYSYTGVLDDFTTLSQTYHLSMPIAGIGGTTTNEIAWATSDDWLTEPGKGYTNSTGGQGYEIQIHVDTSDYQTGHGGQDHSCTGLAPVAATIDSQQYLVCDNQTPKNADGTCQTENNCGELIFVLLNPSGTTYADAVQSTSVAGTLNLKDIFQWAENNNNPASPPHGGQGSVPYMQPGAVLQAISRGWEIVSTGGATQTFTMNSNTMSATGTTAPPSTVPTGLAMVSGSGTCTFSWTQDTNATSGYGIWSDHGNSGAGGFTRAGTTSATTSYVFHAASNTLIHAQVASSNIGGPGAYSAYGVGGSTCTTG